MFFRFLSGKNAQFSGDLQRACSFFQPSGDDWSTFKHGCHWELFWTNGLQGNWDAALESIKLLSEECFWSPAVINYLYAIALVSQKRDYNQIGILTRYQDSALNSTENPLILSKFLQKYKPSINSINTNHINKVIYLDTI